MPFPRKLTIVYIYITNKTIGARKIKKRYKYSVSHYNKERFHNSSFIALKRRGR